MRGSYGTVRRYLGIAGLAALSVPAVVTLSQEVIDAARFLISREAPVVKSDRPVFSPARPGTAWMDDFAALRQAPRPQAASAGHAVTAASGGDIADPAAAGPAASADHTATLGSLSPVDSAAASIAAPATPIATASLPEPVFAAPKPPAAPILAPASTAAAQPAVPAKAPAPANRQTALMLPPVPDPDSHLATRLVEGRRPVVVVTIPPKAEILEAEAETKPSAAVTAQAAIAIPAPAAVAAPVQQAPMAAVPAPAAAAPAAPTVSAPVPQAVAAVPVVVPPAAAPTAQAPARPTETADASLVTGSIAPAAPAEAPSARAAIFGSFAPAPWLRFGAPTSDQPAPVPMAAAPAERPAVTAAVARSPAPKPILARAVATGAAGHGGQPATQGSELAYAATPPATAPFDAVLGGPRQTPRADQPKRPPNMHDWAYGELPASASDPKQKKCLAEGIYFESRGEAERGQAAVAQVILNRVRNPAYPDTVCDVVYQNRAWYNRCQFSFACDGIRDAVREPEAWKTAQRVAEEVVSGKTYLPEVGDSTHYHATWVRPGWRRAMTRRAQIGVHVFYRTVNGGWN